MRHIYFLKNKLIILELLKRVLGVMKNSSHVIGISIVCLCGFYSVSAKAASVNSMDTGFNSILNKNVAVYLDIDSYHDIANPAIPIAVNEANDMKGFSSFGLPKFKEHVMTNAATDSDFIPNDQGDADHNTDDFQDIIVTETADNTGEKAEISSFGLPKFKESVTTGVDNDSDAKLSYRDGEASPDGNNYQGLALSAETDDADDMAEISSFGLSNLDGRDINPELPETKNTMPASSAATTSQSVFVDETNTSSTEIVSLEKAAKRSNEFTEDSSDDSKFVPELEIYAMLLVFLGLMAFTARRRRDII